MRYFIQNEPCIYFLNGEVQLLAAAAIGISNYGGIIQSFSLLVTLSFEQVSEM